jgi:hypothetical protein
MIKLFFYTIALSMAVAPYVDAQYKYICARDNEDDSVFTDVYETEEECNKYCTGIGTVCQKTDESTYVDTQDVDF